MFIRTIDDKNNLKIIVEISNDADYVNSNSFEWVEIPDQDVNIGDYYYNNSVISPNSPEYDSVISPIVFDKEEEYKRAVGLSAPTLDPVNPEDFSDPAPAAPTTFLVEPVPGEDPLTIEPLNPGPPQVPDLSNEPSTPENLTRWMETNNNVILYLNKLKSNEVTMVGNKISFNPPLQYPDGTVQSEFLTIHPDLDDLVSFIEQVDASQKGLIARIKRELNTL